MASKRAIVASTPTAELLVHEQRVIEAERNYAEAWVAVGEAIRALYESREWKKSGYVNFNKYMDARGKQAFGFASAHAKRLMAAARVHGWLPRIPGDPPREWPIKVVAQFTRQFRNPDTGCVVTLRESDVKRLAGKCVERAEQGAPITVAVVKPLVDEALGVTRKKREKQRREVALAPTPGEAMQTFLVEIANTFEGFQKHPEMLDEARRDAPSVVSALASKLKEFGRFLEPDRIPRKVVRRPLNAQQSTKNLNQ